MLGRVRVLALPGVTGGYLRSRQQAAHLAGFCSAFRRNSDCKAIRAVGFATGQVALINRFTTRCVRFTLFGGSVATVSLAIRSFV